MIIPVRCFTCGKVLADLYEHYVTEAAKLQLSPQQPVVSKKGKEKVEDFEKQKEAAATRHFDAIRTGPLLDKLGLTRYCCRRHMLSTVDMMEII